MVVVLSQAQHDACAISVTCSLAALEYSTCQVSRYIPEHRKDVVPHKLLSEIINVYLFDTKFLSSLACRL